MIALLNTVALTFTRAGIGGYGIDGRWVDATTTAVVAQGSLQPVKGKEKQVILTAGKRSEDALRFYTGTPIKTGSQFYNTGADLTTIDGLTYEAFVVENWSRNGLSTDHYKVILVRHEQPEV